MRSNIYILVPAATPTGPVKGAYALANILIERCKVTLVTIKRGNGANARLDPRVHTICLSDHAKSFIGKMTFYRLLLAEAGGKARVASLSMCLSADFLNIFCRKFAFTCSSVRGNLFANYRYDYGIIGLLLAFVHLFSLRWIGRVFAMNRAMAQQILKISYHNSEIVGNFIDEESLNKFTRLKNNTGPYRFIFVGSLMRRKQPILLVTALKELNSRGIAAYVDFIGTGPEQDRILEEVERLELGDFVTFHGFLSAPESLVVKADALVLPSLSEGISRAAMESLYLGVPCVLRDVDGNNELVSNGINGVLFDDERELPGCMLKAAKLSRMRDHRECLLPLAFRQNYAANKYMNIMMESNAEFS